MKRRAFTLIEMLVVIAIIALLASIITPAVTRAVGRARTTRVMSNLRQIGVGMQAFLMDHNQTYPVRFGDSVTYGQDLNGRRRHWQEQMNHYVGGPEPGTNFSIFNFTRNNIWYSPNASKMGTQHYGLNAYMAQPNWRYRHLSIPNPGRTVIVGEINANSSEFRPFTSPAFEGDVVTHYRVSNPRETGLYLFADFHVEALRGDQGEAVNPSWYRWW